MPEATRAGIVQFSESQILAIVIAFYRFGNVLYAPNDELVAMLRERTGKPVLLMKRGIDAALFRPEKRSLRDGILRLGYVGRITPEKSVRFLRDLEIALLARGAPAFQFLIVGDGSEREWLREICARPTCLASGAARNSRRLMPIWTFSPSPREPIPSAMSSLKRSRPACRLWSRTQAVRGSSYAMA